jgi:pyruvate/2-oxoglutarate dehydrogenase complex dihydrolipoamide dehydrogenase (E3) component
VLLGTGMTALHGEGQVESVGLPADLVVDEHLRTGATKIFAIGDCASSFA